MSVPPSTRSTNFSAHAPDEVAPGGSFSISLDVGYAVPTGATQGYALLGLRGATTEGVDAIGVGPGAASIAGSRDLKVTGAPGTEVTVTLESFGAFANVGPFIASETCIPDRPLVLARVPIGVPSVSVGDAAVVEGASGTRSAHFAVTLSHPFTSPVTVSYATEDGTAVAPSDYSPRSGSVSVPAGLVTAVVAVPVRGDTLVEPKESFRIRLRDPVGAVTGRGVGTIIDDD